MIIRDPRICFTTWLLLWFIVEVDHMLGVAEYERDLAKAEVQRLSREIRRLERLGA